mmetsp:Transcript_28388/g.32549  ORF Transcript_28388/g.32549 Transcript_28388/m.32549 type:complete len:118 (+) Transcript_28388:502-855(+)
MYSQESIIDLKVVLSAHHRGHFEFKACPISESQVPDENCFNAHRLEFISDELYNAPKDDNFPGRAYIAPPSMGTYDNSGKYLLIICYKRRPVLTFVRILTSTFFLFRCVRNVFSLQV